MAIIRVCFVIFSLVLLSTIPSEKELFFISRIAFYSMLVLDFINLIRFNAGSKRQMAITGAIITGIITFIDIFGWAKFIIVNSSDKLVGNSEYILMRIFPDVPLEGYIVSSSIVTIIVVFWEVWIEFKRNTIIVGKKAEEAA